MENAARTATWVASWLITICDPRGPSGSKTRGLTKMCTGVPGVRLPSTVVVTAAISR